MRFCERRLQRRCGAVFAGASHNVQADSEAQIAKDPGCHPGLVAITYSTGE